MKRDIRCSNRVFIKFAILIDKNSRIRSKDERIIESFSIEQYTQDFKEITFLLVDSTCV